MKTIYRIAKSELNSLFCSADSLVGIGDIHVSGEYGFYRQDYMGIERLCD